MERLHISEFISCFLCISAVVGCSDQGMRAEWFFDEEQLARLKLSRLI